VISRSSTDVQPVFAAIVDSAGRLCGAESAVVWRFAGDQVQFAASYNFPSETVEMYRRRFPRPLRDTDHLWRVADGSVLNLSDVEADLRTSAAVREIYRARGVRSAVWVPMVRAGQAIGVINVAHRDVAAFSDTRVQLLQTFADQAVIAIENARLFREIEDKSRQLEVASRHKSEFLANMSHEPAHPAERDHRLLGSPGPGHVRPRQRQASRVSARHGATSTAASARFGPTSARSSRCS
jgi:GAF domain-containing protein